MVTLVGLIASVLSVVIVWRQTKILREQNEIQKSVLKMQQADLQANKVSIWMYYTKSDPLKMIYVVTNDSNHPIHNVMVSFDHNDYKVDKEKIQRSGNVSPGEHRYKCICQKTKDFHHAKIWFTDVSEVQWLRDDKHILTQTPYEYDQEIKHFLTDLPHATKA